MKQKYAGHMPQGSAPALCSRPEASAMFADAAAHDLEQVAETPPPIMAAEPARKEDAA